MPATQRTRAARTFWWDREPATEAGALRAVIFDADSALAAVEHDVPRAGLVDVVMSLFVAGVWVGVVSSGRRARTETAVRHLIGDGLVETIVTVDDLPEGAAVASCDAELYKLALWELGITPHDALAITGSACGLQAATAAELPAVAMAAGDCGRFAGAVEVRGGYDGPEPLRVAGCQRAHRRWRIQQLAA